jgi:predicted RNase H-like HicB family nuclease
VKHEFKAVIEKDGDWYIAYCPEIPGANGQGLTRDEARSDLAEAISLILEDRRDDGLSGIPDDAVQDTVTVE